MLVMVMALFILLVTRLTVGIKGLIYPRQQQITQFPHQEIVNLRDQVRLEFGVLLVQSMGLKINPHNKILLVFHQFHFH
jgi:hypothetical protein